MTLPAAGYFSVPTRTNAEAKQAQDDILDVVTTLNTNALSLASQAEAEAGVDNTKAMTPLRSAQAIAAQVRSFKTISVSGQSDVVADTLADTLTLAAGSGVAITTDATTDTVTVSVTASGQTFKNRLINGGMSVDQRNAGSSQTFTAGAALAYCVDRWYGYCTGANVTGAQYTATDGSKRYRFTGAASVTGVGFGQRVEAANSRDMAGGKATLSCVLSSSSLTSITWTAYYANSADSFGTLASPTRTQIATGTWTISSTEATYSATFDVPAGATTGIEIVLTGGALLGSQTLTIGKVQLEAGSSATAFEALPEDVVLARCQRYFEKSYNQGVASGTASSPGFCFAGATSAVPQTSTYAFIPFKVCKRASPTVTTFSYGGTTSAASTRGGTELAAGSATPWAGSTANFTVNNNSAGSISPDFGGFIFHYTASAEL